MGVGWDRAGYEHLATSITMFPPLSIFFDISKQMMTMTIIPGIMQYVIELMGTNGIAHLSHRVHNE